MFQIIQLNFFVLYKQISKVNDHDGDSGRDMKRVELKKYERQQTGRQAVLRSIMFNGQKKQKENQNNKRTGQDEVRGLKHGQKIVVFGGPKIQRPIIPALPINIICQQWRKNGTKPGRISQKDKTNTAPTLGRKKVGGQKIGHKKQKWNKNNPGQLKSNGIGQAKSNGEHSQR